MIAPATAFAAAGAVTVLGWLGLFAALAEPRARAPALAAALAVAALIAAVYIVLLVGPHTPTPGGGFGSIAAVRALFADDAALAAGWLHYLAFDLFVGRWIVENGLARGVPRLAILPCLPVVFIAGPAGLLLYLALRAALARRDPMAE